MMPKVLFAWELGANLGHIARDMPVARLLRSRGHEVLFAARDMRQVSDILAAENFPCIQAPCLVGGKSKVPPASYAEILLANGYWDATILRALVDNWTRLFRDNQIDIVVSNHAPTAILASRLIQLPAITTAIGFELPPESPQSFRTWDAFATDSLKSSEAQAVDGINSVLQMYRQVGVASTADLFSQSRILMTTFPELDHYGPRESLRYVGSISGIIGQDVNWPPGERARAFAYLRRTVPNIEAMLEALSTSSIDTICVMPDADLSIIDHYRKNRSFNITPAPIKIDQALRSANLVITYGTGMVHDALLAGRPVLTCPQNAEQYLACRQAVRMGAGILLPVGVTAVAIKEIIGRLSGTSSFSKAADAFRTRYRDHTSLKAAMEIVREIERLS